MIRLSGLVRIFALVCVLTYSHPFYSQETPSNAVVDKMKGQVLLERGGSRSDILPKTKLYLDDVISTREKSLVILYFTDHSKIVLGPNSQLKIQGVNQSKTSIVHLLTGQLRALVKKSKQQSFDKFIVKTKNASMGVRGTDFQVEFSKKLETQLYVKTGLVHLQNHQGHAALVGRGTYSKVDQGGNLYPAVEASPNYRQTGPRLFWTKSYPSQLIPGEANIMRTVRICRENVEKTVKNLLQFQDVK